MWWKPWSLLACQQWRRLNFGFLIISELERMIFLYRQIREALDIPRTFSSAAPRRMNSEYPCLSSLSVKEYNKLGFRLRSCAVGPLLNMIPCGNFFLFCHSFNPIEPDFIVVAAHVIRVILRLKSWSERNAFESEHVQLKVHLVNKQILMTVCMPNREGNLLVGFGLVEIIWFG